jgi:signal transduction histidine kinase
MPNRGVQLRLYAVFTLGWIVASVATMRSAFMDGASNAITAGWFFVAGTGALVAALIDRDVQARRTTQRLLAEREALIESLGLVTDPRLTQLALYHLLDELLDRARGALRGDSAAIYLLAADGVTLELTATSGVAMPSEPVPIRVGDGIIGSVAGNRRGIAVPDAVEKPWRMASLMAAPLVAEGHLVGVFLLGFARSREFRGDDLRLLQVVADRAAVAIEAARHEREARRATLSAAGARVRLALLADAGRVLTASYSDVGSMARALGPALVPTFFDLVSFHWLVADGRAPVVAWCASDELDDEAPVEADWRAAVRSAPETGDAVLHWGSSLGAEELWPVRAVGLTSLVLLPVLARGHVVAVMVVATAGRRRGLRPGDVDALRELGSRVEATIERVLLEGDTQAAALRALESEARVLALYDASPVGIVELDGQRTPVRWNRAAERLFGWPAFAAGALRHVEVPPSALALIGDGARPMTGEVALAEADVELIAVPLREPAGTHGMVLAAVDVTERRQIAEQLQQAQRMEAIARMAGGIAHDFNNVLMVITGYADLLLRRPLDDEVREDVDAMRSAAVRAAEFTRKLLTISRRQMVQPQVVDVAEAVRSLGDVLRVMLGSGVDITLDVGSPPSVFLDPAQLEQVVLNLAINARDAMPDRGELRIAAHRDSDDWAVLEVSDTGEGMDASTVEVCFEPFFTTKDRTKGTGLGLSTVYSVITQAGGSIQVDSELGRGTTFTIRLPAAGDRGEVVAADRGDLDERALRILVVDDEPDVRSIVGDMLELEGHFVRLAPSGEQALALAADHELDLLVSDVVMPGMRGPELARKLVEAQPRVRVVLMSSHVDDEDALRREAPDAVFLAKPFSADTLRATIAAAQGSKR